jgi:hypothetical protein
MQPQPTLFGSPVLFSVKSKNAFVSREIFERERQPQKLTGATSFSRQGGKYMMIVLLFFCFFSVFLQNI